MAVPFTVQRTIILAPHPDDDVIAAGGLIQRVLAAAGDVHVVFVTDGENNPWPQRYRQRKFFLDALDRASWGLMRRREAIASLACLGLGESAATFLAYPDQGLAGLARRGDMRLRDALRGIFDAIRPTLIVSPSRFDLHADHRAIAYYAHAAAPETPIATYVVHGSGPDGRIAWELELTPAEQQRKREAIECHASQLLLSRGRFLAYVQREELFFRAEHDVVTVDSTAREWLQELQHSLRALFGIRPRPAIAHPSPTDVAANVRESHS